MNPTISVCVTHQLEINRPYLDLCLEALDRTCLVEYEVLVISGEEKEHEIQQKQFRFIHDPDLNTATLKINYFLKAKSPNSRLTLLLSDDVVISEYMIHDMIEAMNDREMIMNPMSNSDCFSLYEADIYLGKKRIFPDMSLDDLIDTEKDLIFRYPRKNKCLVPVQSVSFYCTMIPMSVWEKVGLLDENLEYRHNDQDFCFRAMKKAIPAIVNMGAFAFHFGSRTLKHYGNELKDKCTEHFRKKYEQNQN